MVNASTSSSLANEASIPINIYTRDVGNDVPVDLISVVSPLQIRAVIDAQLL